MRQISEQIMRQLLKTQVIQQASLEESNRLQEEQRIFDALDSHADQF
jgi:hypothetical protein